ncbi:MAG: ABC transporter ATP-binding protein [Streptosporangiales bacterium]
MTTAPLLGIEGLHTSFRTGGRVVEAVNDLSMSLSEGHTLGLVGESGSGKSATAYSIIRLLPKATARISAEHVTFLGRDLVQLPSEELRRIRGRDISMIFQEPQTALNPVHRVGDQVVEAIRTHRSVPRSKALAQTIDLFDEVGIREPHRRVGSYPHELSGGQKQRVLIAMALSCDPKLLIADEPTTSLDVSVQAQILALIRRLREERGMAILFVTHDLGVIAEIADEVAVLFRGRLVEYGTVTEIFTDPQHPYTKGLLACRPRLDSPYKRLPTVSDFMDVEVDASGEPVTVEKEMSDARLQQLAEQGRGRLLSPRSELARLGYPFEEADHAPDVSAVLEDRTPLLAVRDLQVHFRPGRGIPGGAPPVRAVDGISFDVYPGQTLGLVGESGCGKSTTGRAILRLVPITGGTVEFDGTDLSRLKGGDLRALRPRMQIVFQDPYGSLNPRKTVGSVLGELIATRHPADSKQALRDRAARLLGEVDLEPAHLDRYPHQFSGGQRQRVSIARALAVEPDFLICDESVSALDVSVQAQVLNLLKDLQEDRGLTYIFISHDLSVVKFMSDMMAIMRAGKLIEYGPSEAIYAHPADPYTQQLIDAIPDDSADSIRRRQSERAVTAP